MGERSILIELEPEISENCLNKILFHKNQLEKHYLKENVEVINTYSSLLIYYISDIENIYDEITVVKALIVAANISKIFSYSLHYIPVCYDPIFGMDLYLLSAQKNLSTQQIIDLHCAPEYTVYFTGFLPGFLYLGGLDGRLQISRKTSPRLEVPKGAVGIGENQTGIYSKLSPGGWQIIGNSPINLFDINTNPPCEILAGDKVKFYPISLIEYHRISEEVKRGKFILKRVKNEG